MKLLCKKYYKPTTFCEFIVGEYYKFDSKEIGGVVFYSNGIVTFYNNKDLYKWNNMFMYAYDYFYTESEVRKIKLEELNK